MRDLRYTAALAMWFAPAFRTYPAPAPFLLKQSRPLLPVVIHHAATPAKCCDGVGRTLRKDSLGEANLRLLFVPGDFGRLGNERASRGQGIRSMHHNRLQPTPRIVPVPWARHSVTSADGQDLVACAQAHAGDRDRERHGQGGKS